jgi:hypothetical protein
MAKTYHKKLQKRLESGDIPACLNTRIVSGTKRVRIEIDMPTDTGHARRCITVWDFQAEETMRRYASKNPIVKK